MKATQIRSIYSQTTQLYSPVVNDLDTHYAILHDKNMDCYDIITGKKKLLNWVKDVPYAMPDTEVIETGEINHKDLQWFLQKESIHRIRHDSHLQ